MARDEERFMELLNRVVADNAEILRRLALGPGVEDKVRQEQEIVAEALRDAELSPKGTGWCAPSP